MQRRRWELGRANDQSCRRGDCNCERDKTLGDWLAVDVQPRLNADLERQPQALESPVCGRVEAGRDLETLGLGLYRGAMYSTGQAKALLQEGYARLALAIALLKALLSHVALLIKQEHARIGHPPMLVAFGDAIRGMVLEDMLVAETEGTDDGAALIREEGIGNVLFGGKSGQHVHGVVADGKRHDVVTLKVWQTLLQLHELRFAKGSPCSTAVKDDQGPPTVTDLVQVNALTVLIRQDDVREALPNCRANRGEVDTKVEGSSHKCSFSHIAPAVLSRG
jgi:hypothetical protein